MARRVITVEDIAGMNIGESILEGTIASSQIEDEDLAELWEEAVFESEDFLEAVDNIETYVQSYINSKE